MPTWSKRIPFDSLCLKAIEAELQPFVGSKVQRVIQPSERQVVLELYGKSGQGWLLLDCSPESARVHFVTRKPKAPPAPLNLQSALRAHAEDGGLIGIDQVGFDRILRLRFAKTEGEVELIAELMGKHSNLVLVDSKAKILAASHWVKPSQSRRPIVGGQQYVLPFEARKSLLNEPNPEAWSESEGASPFLLAWLRSHEYPAAAWAELKTRVKAGSFSPFIIPELGAYPLPLEPVGLIGTPKASLSVALEQFFAAELPRSEANQLKKRLTTQLERVQLSREVALRDLKEALEAGAKASKVQMQAELIQAFAYSLEDGTDHADLTDYEGNPIRIKLDPELSIKENALKLFDKAKKAKGRASSMADQFTRLNADLVGVTDLLVKIDVAGSLNELKDLEEEASAKRWLFHAAAVVKEERPFEGHRIRELLGPNGYAVLYGENSTSNDYLTLRVAKGSDYWLHVRGGVSAHVIVRTLNQPERVPREVLMYAAKVAAQNSPSKHSQMVAVDYTLRKYVRKSRGAPAGSVLYTHEKTLHV